VNLVLLGVDICSIKKNKESIHSSRWEDEADVWIGLGVLDFAMFLVRMIFPGKHDISF
jgi:hypothetical protein